MFIGLFEYQRTEEFGTVEVGFGRRDRRPTYVVHPAAAVGTLVEVCPQRLGTTSDAQKREGYAYGGAPLVNALLFGEGFAGERGVADNFGGILCRDADNIHAASLLVRREKGADAVHLEIAVAAAVCVADEDLDATVLPYGLVVVGIERLKTQAAHEETDEEMCAACCGVEHRDRAVGIFCPRCGVDILSCAVKFESVGEFLEGHRFEVFDKGYFYGFHSSVVERIQIYKKKAKRQKSEQRRRGQKQKKTTIFLIVVSAEKVRVEDGIRTHDLRNHNPSL